ncbi:MAG: hypothetical protein WBN66_10695 [Smithella sp.]
MSHFAMQLEQGCFLLRNVLVQAASLNQQKSVTARINRRFTNDFGTFLYRHIKPELFWGYTETKTEYGHYLLAEPEKALLDYLYLNLSKIRNENDFAAVRLNLDVIKEKIDSEKFLKYLSAFNINKMKVWAMQCLP